MPYRVPRLLALLLAAAMPWLSALAQAPPAPSPAAGDDYGLNQTYLKATGEQPPAETDPLPKTIGLIINWMLGLVGFGFLMIMVFGGIGWMTAGGNEEKVAKAKAMINAAIAGMIVIFISYALADAIVGALITASGTG